MSPKSIYTDYLRHRTVNPAPKELMACERCVYDSGEHRADCQYVASQEGDEMIRQLREAMKETVREGSQKFWENFDGTFKPIGQHENAAERKPSRMDLLAGPSPSADRPIRFLSGMAVSPAFHDAMVLFYEED